MGEAVMSLWQRIRDYLHRQKKQVEVEQAEAVAIEPEEPQMPDEVKPEEPTEFEDVDDSGDTVMEFEQATDVQPTEPPEQEPLPDPQPEEFEDEADEGYETPVFDTPLIIPYPDMTAPEEGDQPDQLPNIPEELMQEYVKLSGTGATTVDNSFPHGITVSSPEYHVKAPSTRSGIVVPLIVTWPAKITASSGSGPWSYTVVEQEQSSAGYGNWATKSGGKSGTAYNFAEDTNVQPKDHLKNDTIVQVQEIGDRLWFQAYNTVAGHMFPVTLVKTGGLGGSATTACEYVYTVVGLFGEGLIATNLDPTATPHKWRRPPFGRMFQATYGYAHYDTSYTLVISWINEVLWQRGVTFPIILEQTAGDPGTATQETSWTYTVTDAITSAELGTAVDPTAGNHKWVRLNLGQMSKATFGYASLDTSDNLVIGWINEQEIKEACA